MSLNNSSSKRVKTLFINISQHINDQLTQSDTDIIWIMLLNEFKIDRLQFHIFFPAKRPRCERKVNVMQIATMLDCNVNSCYYLQVNVKVKAKVKLKQLLYMPGEPLRGFQEVKAARFHDSRQMMVVRFSALNTGRLYPQEIFLTLSQPQGHSVLGWIMWMKNSNDNIELNPRSSGATAY